MLTKGVKTSEMWVVILIVLPHVANMLGYNVPTDGLEDVPKHISDLAQVIQTQTGDSGTGTTTIAAIYVIGRQLLKWREISHGSDK